MATADRLIEVFNEARARSAGPEREAFLAAECRDEPELIAQVRSLLDAESNAGNAGRLKPLATLHRAGIASERSGDRIGRYKLLEAIGEGGCGIVYMAEQEEPVRRMVALKVINPGMDTKQVVARFEAERQALAMMDHPNIARVFDGGVCGAESGESQSSDFKSQISNLRSQSSNSESQISDFKLQISDSDSRPPPGRPYFVMELVRGVRITDYCQDRRLPVRERIDLFLQV
jgi:serine/threonine protein kinase